ncbi:MAG: CBS domain-containing protein [Chloroflexi bacterium]|nr:MAG: CBS domain-containing protein [Chloroflexota bacterium]
MRERLAGSEWDHCVVVDGDGIVLGLLSGDRLLADARLPAELAMRLAPSTFRPSIPVEEMGEYMRQHQLQHVLVTTSDGILVGSLPRRTVEEALR